MGGCKAFIGEEFRLKAFLLGGTEPALFATPQVRWPGDPWTFVIYRLAMAVYQVTWMTLVIVHWGVSPFYSEVDTRGKWFIYVSNWTYTLTTAYLITAAITAVYWSLIRPRCARESKHAEKDLEMNDNNPVGKSLTTGVDPDIPDGEGKAVDAPIPTTPWYFILQRYLHVYACAGSIFVTLLFWILEYDPESTKVQAFNVHVHGGGVALMIIDILIVAAPVRILNFIYVSMTAVVYFIFTAIYHAAGGKNPSGETAIYSDNLDWGEVPSKSAIVAVLTVFIGAPVCHLIFYALYRLRLALASWCCCCTSRGKYVSRE